MASVGAEIRGQDLLNTSLDYYRYTNPLGKGVHVKIPHLRGTGCEGVR